ncbi:MAG: ATP-binding cassette domain-containing protein [Clostridia bacterium]|nr:ATP-binding cassette domain-containing protein [Clostridia bacterium]
MDYVISTDKLTKIYPSKIAVNEVSIGVSRGDIYGLIGKNGAGKTTLMKMLLGLTLPDKGKINIFGDSSALDRKRARIGSLIEDPGLYGGATAEENLKRFSILYGADQSKITELLELVGLGDTGAKKVKAFSLGMKQRLGLAVALLNDPDILILDEPMNGLDPAGIKDMRDLFLKLNQRGVTFIISSHILDELQKVVNVYGILNDGKLVEQISAKDLEERCARHVKISCSDNAAAMAILKESFPEIACDERADGLYLMSGEIDAAKINTILVKGGVEVSAVVPSTDDFENFFIERLG